MAGPMSAPNGDRRIVRGDLNEEFKIVRHETEYGTWLESVPLRTWLAQHNRLVTGKTELKRK
jgi:hypothetical protein